jgi:hypothetical protein
VVDTALQAADDLQRQILDQHRDRLTTRIDDIDRQIRSHGSRLAMWNWGRRPEELHEAVSRRIDHLTHTAITTGQPWVTTVVTEWSQHHPDGHVSDVQHLIRDIAAYRERANHGDPNDPLGPPPHHPALHRQHIDLDRHLHTTPTQQPDQSLSR